MVRPKSDNPKPRFNRVRSMSSMLLGGGGGSAINAGTKLRKENRKTSQPVSIQNALQHDAGAMRAKRPINELQQGEILTRLEVGARLEQDLKISENRIEALKETLEDFASVVATRRDETKAAIRQHHTKEVVNARLKERNKTTDMRQAVAVYNLQHQAAAYEREMRVLVSQLAAARDEVAQQYSEIVALSEDIAVINLSSRKLAIKNGELASENTRLHQRLVDLHEDHMHLSATTASTSDHSA